MYMPVLSLWCPCFTLGAGSGATLSGADGVRKPPGPWKVSDLDITVDPVTPPLAESHQGASTGSDSSSRECTVPHRQKGGTFWTFSRYCCSGSTACIPAMSPYCYHLYKHEWAYNLDEPAMSLRYFINALTSCHAKSWLLFFTFEVVLGRFKSIPIKQSTQMSWHQRCSCWSCVCSSTSEKVQRLKCLVRFLL